MVLVLASFPSVDAGGLGVRYCKLPRQLWVSTKGSVGAPGLDCFYQKRIVSLLGGHMMVDFGLPGPVGLAPHDNMVYRDKAYVRL